MITKTVTVGTSDTEVIAASPTTKKIYGLILANTTTSAITVTLKEGTDNKMIIRVPADDTKAILSQSKDIPLLEIDSNNALNAVAGAAGVELTAIYEEDTV